MQTKEAFSFPGLTLGCVRGDCGPGTVGVVAHGFLFTSFLAFLLLPLRVEGMTGQWIIA